MRANRRTDTKPEMALRRALHRQGYRFRKDYRLDLDGGQRVRPDIAFTARRVAVFVDGCFWHACPEHGSKPAVNDWYWGPSCAATSSGTGPPTPRWPRRAGQVVRIWEHEPLDEAVTTVVAALARPVGYPAGRSRSAPDMSRSTRQPADQPRLTIR